MTEGPGLAGALLVGITYAKALSFGLGKPLIAVNHLEGHIHAVLMETRESAGGCRWSCRCSRWWCRVGIRICIWRGRGKRQTWSYRNVGRTVDDAAGEAYDKVAKLLGLGYPGGPWIDALAPHGKSARGAVSVLARSSRARTARGFAAEQEGSCGDIEGRHFDFSFSGIKTAVLRYVETHHMRESIEARREALAADPGLKPKSSAAVAALCDPQTLDLIASFQYAVVGNLLRQTFAAAESFGAHGMVVSGGVAANSELRRRFQAEADRRGLPVAFPSLALSTDNAAMIAAAAWPKFVAENFAAEDLGATPQLRLGDR